MISGTIEHVVYLPDFDRDLHVCLKYFLHFLVNTSTPTRDNVLCKYSISIKTICLSWKFLTSKNSNAAVVRPLTHGYRQQQVGVIWIKNPSLLSWISALFGVLFTGLNNAIAYQKLEILGMPVGSFFRSVGYHSNIQGFNLFQQRCDRTRGNPYFKLGIHKPYLC